jgi:hypothetical protein
VQNRKNYREIIEEIIADNLVNPSTDKIMNVEEEAI